MPTPRTPARFRSRSPSRRSRRPPRPTRCGRPGPGAGRADGVGAAVGAGGAEAGRVDAGTGRARERVRAEGGLDAQRGEAAAPDVVRGQARAGRDRARCPGRLARARAGTREAEVAAGSGGAHAGRGRGRLAEPAGPRSHASVASADAALRRPACDHRAHPRSRLGARPRRPPRRRPAPARACAARRARHARGAARLARRPQRRLGRSAQARGRHDVRRPHAGAAALLQRRRPAGARHRPPGREARPRAPRPRRPAAPDLPGRQGRHRAAPRRRAPARVARVPGRDLSPGHRLVPDLRPPVVRAAGRRLGAHLRPGRGHLGARRDPPSRGTSSPAASSRRRCGRSCCFRARSSRVR